MSLNSASSSASDSTRNSTTSTSSGPALVPDGVSTVNEECKTTSGIETCKEFFTPTLTSIFTPPSACLQAIFTLGADGFDRTRRTTVYRGIASQCYPPDYYLATPYTADVTDGGERPMQDFYSPGWCPSGYVGRTTNVDAGAETSVACCPTYADRIWFAFGTDAVCDGSTDAVTYVEGSTTVNPTESSYRLIASPINVVYRSSDLTLFTTSSNSSTAATPTGTTAAGGSPSLTFNGGSGTPGLSTGAQAGIGVGVAIAVIAISVALALLFIRRKRKQRLASANNDSATDSAFTKPELSGEDVQPVPVSEKDGSAVHEASNVSRPNELGEDVRAELDSGWRGHEAHS